MKTTLSDIIKHTAAFETIKVTGTDKLTKIEGVNEDRHVILAAELKQPIPELKGVFGMVNLPLLGGLLNFTPYLADGAAFKVKRTTQRGADTVEQFEFTDATGSGSSIFRCMSPERIPPQAEISPIPWIIEFQPTKARISEFEQLNRLYSSVDKLFSVKTDKKQNLIFTIGEDNSSTHRGSMVFETGISGAITNDPAWTTGHFLSTLKLAGENPVTLRISNHGLLAVEIESPFATYKFLLRANAR